MCNAQADFDEFVDHSNTPTTWCGKVFKVQNIEIAHVTLTASIRGQSVITRLILNMANPGTKFEVSSLSRSGDILKGVV